MITYRYIWENNDQQYGNDTIIKETDPFLQKTIPVNIDFFGDLGKKKKRGKR